MNTISVRLSLISGISLLSISAFNVQAMSWQGIKDAAKKAAYYVTPGSWNPVNFTSDNYYQVPVEGAKFFRSKTMTPDSLANHIDADKLKGILILRENGLNDYWYTLEKAVAEAKNVELHRVELNARVLPSQENLTKILGYLKEYKEAGKALLIHCVAGVDRTGMVAAMAKLLEENATVEQALEQLTLKFGHHEWRFPHMRETIKQLAALKGQYGSLEEAIKHFPKQEFTPSAMPVRAFNDLLSATTNLVKENPKTALGIALISACGVAAAYAHKNDKLVPFLQSAKEKVFGK